MLKNLLNYRKGFWPFLLILLCISAISATIFLPQNQSIILKLSEENNWILKATEGYLLNTKMTEKEIGNIKVCIIDSGFNFHESTLNLVNLNNGNYEVNDRDHGTLMASIIGANEFGIIPNIELYVYNIPKENLNTQTLSKAITDVVNYGVDIINISLSSSFDDSNLYDSIQYAIKKGTTIVSSSGNTGNEQDLYPSAYNLKGLISVGAIDRNLNIFTTTTYNDSIDVFAPGEIFYSKTETNISGTSIATPVVTSLVILVKAKYPYFTPDQIEDVLITKSNEYLVDWKWHKKNINVISFKKSLDLK